MKRWCAGIIRNGGVVSPSSFIPVAEEAGADCRARRVGVARAAGSGVLAKAAARRQSLPFNQAWRSRPPRAFRPAGDRPGVQPPELEITENALISDFSGLAIRRLKALGVRIAMDDFGSGYSSLCICTRSHSTRSRSTGRSCPISIETRNRWCSFAASSRSDMVSICRSWRKAWRRRNSWTFRAGDLRRGAGLLIGRPLPIENYADVVGATNRAAAVAAGG